MPQFGSGRYNLITMSILLKLTCAFNIVPVKIPIVLFSYVGIFFPNIYMEKYASKNSQRISVRNE